MKFNQRDILIFTRTQGVVGYTEDKPGSFRKLPGFAEVDKFLSDNPVYCGSAFRNGEFAIGALTGGVIVFDSTGVIRSRFNKSTGLQDNTIYWLYTDQNQQLWAALDNGISLIQSNLPFRYYSEGNGLNGSPMCLHFFKNNFYVGTSQYLHIQKSSDDFEPIDGIEGQIFQFFNSEDKCFVAAYQGLFEINGRKLRQVSKEANVIAVAFGELNRHPDKMLLGSDNGLYLLELKESSWQISRHLPGFTKSAYEIIEDSAGNIWIFTAVDLYKLRLNTNLDSVISSKQYTAESGLPSKYACPYKLNSGEIVFGTEQGVFKYLPESDRFIRHQDFKMLTGKVLPLVQFSNGDIWFEETKGSGNFEKGVLKWSNGRYLMIKTPFYKFTDVRCYEGSHNIIESADGTVFIATSSGLIQYDPATTYDFGRPFSTLIREVLSKDKPLSLSNENSIPYKGNDMVFRFAAAFYENSEKNRYCYRLLGSDSAWSAWTSETMKEYTNLSEGKYIFQVRAKNQYQNNGSTDSFGFRILTPWYRTWTAYVTYAILALLTLRIVVMMNVKRLVRQKEHLQKIVSERTAEVIEQKKEIQAANRELNKTNNLLNESNAELKTTIGIVNLQKSQIETALRDITTSINYAQKIQAAVLPPQNLMSQLLPEHFVLFKPCSVVSGDFYWVKRVNQYSLIATVDCTGHGVPGAFMSMLGIGLLNEIVSDREVNSAGEILNKLRDEVKKSLKQEGKDADQRDGMNIALSIIDWDRKELQYAGAYHPLYLIRRDDLLPGSDDDPDYRIELLNDFGLLEIRADMQPVGVYDIEKSFTTHYISLRENDSVYTFTDGYIDQKGGPGNRRFMSGPFKKLLLEIHGKRMDEQQQILDNTIEAWRGSNDQIDDILVVGIRIP